ncbi:TRAP transporter permease [Elioraea tepida]|uniref:TRAP transporter permease n=1 Tax=Elioraea tepida TaxID=2843330 RepID=UPI001F2CE33C|nr:TRAP transporter permease [Elioraea tepida]
MSTTLDHTKAEALERQYDQELNFRTLHGWAGRAVSVVLVSLSLYQYWTAGFGVPPEHWHNAIYLGTVLALIFLLFGAGRSDRQGLIPRLGGIPLTDWLFAAASVAVVAYLPLDFDQLTFRIGVPNTTDLVTGTILILLILEATRRSMGIVLPIIVLVFILYGLFGYLVPGVLAHPGASFGNFISQLYMTQEGIFGIPLKVVATFVFHFVLFGVIATKMGLGQFFIDLATVAAGRYPGGPAKVSVLSSALFGSISGSSIANTVTTGSLTIPAMMKIGYRGSFAGAVEAAASAGGQITPPIMGAAAFIMTEFLGVPYTTIILAAIVPAAMHYLGVLVQVHLEAKRSGIRGMEESDLPRLWPTLRRGWPTVLPLIILVGTIIRGYTPYLAAFNGITACIVIGLINPMNRMTLRELWDAFETGAKYALAVGVAAAAVGIVVGVITLTGAAFRLSFMVTQAAGTLAATIHPFFALLPVELASLNGITLFLTLLFVALTCIAMGAGIPTTALYIVLAAIAAPAVEQLGVPPIAAHLFIFYYGLLADLTPPVCVAAYAAAGIAGANPFRTGLTAFRLGSAKALVPFVFAYSPAMLIVAPGFTVGDFLLVTLSCALGVCALGVALTGYAFAPMGWLARAPLLAASLLMISPGLTPTLLGAAIVVPILTVNYLSARGRPQAASG